MASENMNRWAASFDLNRMQLYPLETCSVFLFQTKDIIHGGVGGNEDLHGRMPTYHVWVNDKWAYCGQDMQAAYKVYRKALIKAMGDAAT